MTKAIFYKELLKTRRVFWVSLLIAILFGIYAIMCIRRVGTSHGAEHIWLIMLMKDQTFIDAIKYLPPVLGIAMGVAQMSPETHLKRLKLTLHLPFPQNRMIFTMLCAGLSQLLVIFIVQATPLAYNGIIPEAVVFTLLLMLLSIYSVYRFKEGRID